MGLFSTRNSDGASGLAEPTSTIPLPERAKLQRCAEQHSCDSVAELVEAPSSAASGPYDPSKADRN
jgi:hypothetical protein